MSEGSIKIQTVEISSDSGDTVYVESDETPNNRLIFTPEILHREKVNVRFLPGNEHLDHIDTVPGIVIELDHDRVILVLDDVAEDTLSFEQALKNAEQGVDEVVHGPSLAAKAMSKL